MTLEAWLLFVAAEALLCVTPGPAVLLVLSAGLLRGRTAATQASLGILTANGVYFALSALGVGALIASSQQAFALVRLVGAAYLIWLGLTTIIGLKGSLSLRSAQETDPPARLFRTGLLMKLADPKTLFYFVALLPQFVDPRGPVGLQIAILAGTSVVIEFGVLFAYGNLAGRFRRLVSRPTFAAWTDRFAGSALIAAGAGLADGRR